MHAYELGRAVGDQALAVADGDRRGEGRPTPCEAASSRDGDGSAAGRRAASRRGPRRSGPRRPRWPARAVRPRPSRACRPRSAAAATRPGSVSGRSAVSSVRVRSSAVPGRPSSPGLLGGRLKPDRLARWSRGALPRSARGRRGRARRAAHERSRAHRTASTGPIREARTSGTRTGRAGRAVGRSSDWRARQSARTAHRCGTVPDSHRIPLRRQRA